MQRRVALFDPALRATVVARRPLYFRGGADAVLDRPAHVRAGSSLAWLGDRIAVIQDDANFVALVDPATGLADAVTLPAGESGLRQFDDGRGNKRFKLDLEACCAVPGANGPQLLAFGSGSKTRRRHVVTVDRWDGPEPQVSFIDASALYLALEAAADFAGSDMNIEGALAMPRTLRLFGRGNGKRRGSREPLNATCDISLRALRSYLSKPARARVPQPTAIAQYDLGELEGLPLGFTDAARCDGVVLYSAAAEASKDSADDGEVSGSAIGVLSTRGPLRYAVLTGPRGARIRDKVEGLVPVPGESGQLYVVIDADNPRRPSELCTVRLEGNWR